MKSFVKRSLVATTVATAAFGLAVTSASATTLAGWTVVNPNTNGTFTSALVVNSVAELVDTTTGSQVDCYSGTASGTAPSGTGLSNPVAKITAAQWGVGGDVCDGPLGSSFNATLTSGTFIGLNAASHSGGVTSGSLSGVNVKLTGSTIVGTCTASITGTVNNVTYTNSTGVLSINNGTGLTIGNVSNCSTLMANGDSAKFSAKYKLAKAITVTPTP